MAEGSVIKMEIKAPLIASKAKPGQFLILKVNDEGERIPLTMANTNPDKGIVTIIFQVVGKTTALLKTLNAGEEIQDVIGPLGKATDISKTGTVVTVGGGTGVAVMYPITRGFKQAGNYVISIIGARTKDLLILEDEVKEVSDETIVCTDDGSYGVPGFVTTQLKEILDNKKIDEALIVGPVPMMKAACEITKEYGVKTLVSLNPIMVDGTGMCGACRVVVGDKTLFACVDGPEFDGHQVDFDLLQKRLNAYKEQEVESYKLFQQKCG